MHTTNLRKVGGSIMLAVPPPILDLLHLKAGSTVNIEVEKDCLIIEAKKRPHYSLEELLAQCDASAKFDPAEREWLDSKTSGRELL